MRNLEIKRKLADEKSRSEAEKRQKQEVHDKDMISAPDDYEVWLIRKPKKV